MKKTLIACSLIVTAFSFSAMPVGGASAHAMDSGDASWQTRKCDRITMRLADRNASFDQDSDRSTTRIQHLIDRQNDLGCPAGTIVDTLAQNGNFTTLIAAVQAAGLVDALNAPGDKTVFAPTDQAFANLPAGTVDSLLANIPALTDILTYHVVNGKVDADAAQELTQATALNGKTLNISVRDCDLYINDSKVVLEDIPTSNGIIHVVDNVLLPQ